MLKRLFVFVILASAMGCEVEEEKGQARPKSTAARAKQRPSGPAKIVSRRDAFEKGTLRGVHLLKEGTLVLDRTNLLQNSSFEWDHEQSRSIRDGLALAWWIWGEGRAYHLYSDRSVPSLPNEATHGARSQRIDLKADGKKPLQLIQEVRGVEGGVPYTFSADVKIDDPKQLQAALTILFYRGNKWLAAAQTDWASPTEFTRLSTTGAMPAEADRIKAAVLLQPKVDGAVGALWIDAALLEPSDKPTTYSSAYSTVPGEFVSPPIDLSATGEPYKLSWIAAQPSPTDLRLQLRAAVSREALAEAQWRGPADAPAYALCIESGPNLLANPSLESDTDGDGTPDNARTVGYGRNRHRFDVVDDAHDGDKALRVEIWRYRTGNRRWEVWSDGPFEKGAAYAFSVWHKEDSATTPINMSVAVQDPDDTMHWGRFGETKQASTEWRRDTLYFRAPETDVKRLYFELNLNGVGWTVTDSYSLRRVVGADEWAVNPVHHGAKWLQYKATFSTSDSYYTPKLFQVAFACGAPVPEVRWLGVLAEDGEHQKYSFNPGQTAAFKPHLVDFSGAESITRARLTLLDPSGKVLKRMDLQQGERINPTECYYTGSYRFAEDADLGDWRAMLEVENRFGRTCREMVVLKVRKPYRKPPQRMTVSALVTDYGFRQYKGEGLAKVLDTYRRAKGLEIWKLSFSWNLLEPMPRQFNAEMIDGIKTFIAAAHGAGAKAQIGIQQQNFPEWVNNGDWDNSSRYRYLPTKRLADTWAHLAGILKDCAGFESYLLINEENAVRDADAYLRAMSRVQAAVRAVDPDLGHRITVRPNTREPYIRTRIGTDGAQDYDYGSGGYPTHSSWYYKEYASPKSQTSCLRMAAFHASPLVFGGPGGIGEIGFFVRKPRDPFGDEERLWGFQRAMKIAYEMGMDEFSLWGGGFSFDALEVYYPKLMAFRDGLLRTPRPSRFDVRLVMDTDDSMYVHLPPHSSRLNMRRQPFAPAYRYLDGKGYVWFYTTPEAMARQSVGAQATVKFSELKGKGDLEQKSLLMTRLRDIEPSGTPLPWPENSN